MVRKALVILALALATQAMAKEQKATPEEMSAAYTELATCLFEQAQSVDDGVSDPISIGKIVNTACDDRRQNIAKLASRGMGYRTNRIYGMVLEEFRQDPTTAAGIVLKVRKLRAGQK